MQPFRVKETPDLVEPANMSRYIRDVNNAKLPPDGVPMPAKELFAPELGTREEGGYALLIMTEPTEGSAL